jgi:hypothetical protein
MTIGDEAKTSVSRKQKLNTRISTAEVIVGVDDVIGSVLWNKRLLDDQGYGIMKSFAFQYFQSAILLESNGSKSASKSSRHSDTTLSPIRKKKAT